MTFRRGRARGRFEGQGECEKEVASKTASGHWLLLGPTGGWQARSPSNVIRLVDVFSPAMLDSVWPGEVPPELRSCQPV